MATKENSAISDDPAAYCMGVTVPMSPFLHEKRIDRINGGRYEGQEIRGALHVIHEGDNVLELGTGLGIVGAVVAKNCRPAKLLSFEANPALIPHINALYQRNNLTDIASVRNEILISAKDRPKSVPFYVHNNYLGSSLGGNANRAKETVEIPTADFNAIKDEFKPDSILMDIEGGELEILENTDLSSVRAIVIEFHPNSYEVSGMKRCKNILRDFGLEPIAGLSTRKVWSAVRQTK